jgi:hypothetical protein
MGHLNVVMYPRIRFLIRIGLCQVSCRYGNQDCHPPVFGSTSSKISQCLIDKINIAVPSWLWWSFFRVHWYC